MGVICWDIANDKAGVEQTVVLDFENERFTKDPPNLRHGGGLIVGIDDSLEP